MDNINNTIPVYVSDVGILRVDEPSKIFEIKESDWVLKDDLYSLVILSETHGLNNPYIASLLLLKNGEYESAIPDFKVDNNKNIELISDDAFIGKILIKGEVLDA